MPSCNGVCAHIDSVPLTLEAVNAYFRVVESLMFDLSIWRCSSELKEYAQRLIDAEDKDVARVSEERKKRNYSDFWVPAQIVEPYRVVLGHMRDKLYTTRQVLHQCLVHPNMNIKASLNDNGAYMTVEEIFDPLRKMYDSLMATGDESVANSRLLDLIRQVRLLRKTLVTCHATLNPRGSLRLGPLASR